MAVQVSWPQPVAQGEKRTELVRSLGDGRLQLVVPSGRVESKVRLLRAGYDSKTVCSPYMRVADNLDFMSYWQ